jgi:hypothetical protein
VIFIPPNVTLKNVHDGQLYLEIACDRNSIKPTTIEQSPHGENIIIQQKIQNECILVNCNRYSEKELHNQINEVSTLSVPKYCTIFSCSKRLKRDIS